MPATGADSATLLSADAKNAPSDGKRARTLAAKDLVRGFFYFDFATYALFALVIVFVPTFKTTSFPMFLPQEMLDDRVAMDSYNAAFIFVSAIGVGYLPIANTYLQEAVYASIFNKVALTVQAVSLFASGLVPAIILVLVLIVDFGTMLITLAILGMYPESIEPRRRKLLWKIPPAPGRSARSYCMEVEGYAMMLFFLVLLLPQVDQHFTSADVNRLRLQDEGIDNLDGFRKGMFHIAAFWAANIYWFFVPAARTMNTQFMRFARWQRCVIFGLFLVIHFREEDYDQTFFNAVALLNTIFLALDVYAELFDNFFEGSALGLSGTRAMLDSKGEGPVTARADQHTAGGGAYVLQHQEELSLMARWCTINSMVLVIYSCVWMALSTSGFPYLFHKVLPGAEGLGYKLHLQDFLLSTLGTISAIFIFPLLPSNPLAQYASKITTFVMPWSSYWFTMQSKLLMHLHGGTPFHMSWVDMGLGTKFTELTTDITFWFATGFMTVVTPALLVLLVIYFLGSPLRPFEEIAKAATLREAVRPLKTAMVQQMVLLIGFTGGWMIFVSSGLPLHTKFLTELAGIPPPIPVDTRVAVQVHRYDLMFAMFVAFGGWMLTDCRNDQLQQVKRCFKLLVSATWLYSVATKVSAHAGGVPAFHQSWVDMFGRPQYSNWFADVLSWLAFVCLNFVAFPYFTYVVSPNFSWLKMIGRNPDHATQSSVEHLLYNRSMFYQHSVVVIWVSGVWMLLTSSGWWWPLQAMAGANVRPLLPSYDWANPTALRVQLQDLLMANFYAVLAVLLDYCPVQQRRQRVEIVYASKAIMACMWALSLWSKVMVNMGEEDLLTWPGTGAFGEWCDRGVAQSDCSKTHTAVDVVWYLFTITGIVIGPVLMYWVARRSVLKMFW